MDRCSFLREINKVKVEDTIKIVTFQTSNNYNASFTLTNLWTWRSFLRRLMNSASYSNVVACVFPLKRIFLQKTSSSTKNSNLLFSARFLLSSTFILQRVTHRLPINLLSTTQRFSCPTYYNNLSSATQKRRKSPETFPLSAFVFNLRPRKFHNY